MVDVLRCGREGFTKINEQLLGFIGSERLIGVGLRHRWGTSRLCRHPIVPEMNPQRAMVIGVLDGVHVGQDAPKRKRPKTGIRCWRPPSIRIPKPCWATHAP